MIFVIKNRKFIFLKMLTIALTIGVFTSTEIPLNMFYDTKVHFLQNETKSLFLRSTDVTTVNEQGNVVNVPEQLTGALITTGTWTVPPRTSGMQTFANVWLWVTQGDRVITSRFLAATQTGKSGEFNEKIDYEIIKKVLPGIPLTVIVTIDNGGGNDQIVHGTIIGSATTTVPYLIDDSQAKFLYRIGEWSKPGGYLRRSIRTLPDSKVTTILTKNKHIIWSKTTYGFKHIHATRHIMPLTFNKSNKYRLVTFIVTSNETFIINKSVSIVSGYAPWYTIPFAERPAQWQPCRTITWHYDATTEPSWVTFNVQSIIQKL